MSRFKICLASFLSIVLSVFYVNVYAETTVTTTPTESTVTTTTMEPSVDGTTKVVETKRTVITNVPAPNAVVPAPAGYVSCVTVEAGWRNDVWMPAHKVCKYENSAQGVAWVEGYWRCNKATSSGVCTNWEWQEGRWEKTYPSY